MTASTGVDVSIRPFDRSDADYAGWAAVHNATFPDHILTADEIRFMDSRQNPEHLSRRVVAEAAGRIVGTGLFGHMSWSFHPRKFYVNLRVHPDSRRRGIGGQLYDRVIAELAPHRPLALRHTSREDYGEGIRFAERRGFAEETRTWESRLDVAAFDPAPFAGAVERVAAQGIALRTLAELEAGDPDFWPKFYDLDVALGHDVPSPEPFTPPPFEHWLGFFKGAPGFLPAGIIVAADGDRYVGASSLWRRAADDELETGLTGVRREYRRRGIALALKLRAIEYARSRGAPVIRTDNASTNRGMLSINEALGFVKQPAWVNMLKVTGDE